MALKFSGLDLGRLRFAFARPLVAVVLEAALLLWLSPAFGYGQSPSVDAADSGESDKVEVAVPKPKYKTESVRGTVVWLNEALQRLHGVSTTADAKQRLLALETEKAELLPILEDLRGRSFRTDQRLRGKPMELLVRRYEKHPLLQVIRVYELSKNEKFEVDYWCDVCAIVMFEKGFCACCQDNNRLRKRIVKDGVTADRD